MALKSIIDIDINDAAFRSYKAIFDRYEAALAKQPEAWAKVNKGIDSSKKSFEALVAAAVAQKGRLEMMAKAQEKADLLTRTTAQRWLDIARSTKSVAGHIAAATASLMKWTGLTGVFTGILGAGGLYGIDRLAATVAAGRRSAMGLGLGYGEQQAFETNFARIVQPDQFLAGVNEALNDVTKRVALFGAGLTPAQVAGKNTAEVAVELIPQLKRLADQFEGPALEQQIEARHLGQFVTLEDMRRLRAMSPAEIQQLIEAYQRDRATFALGGDVQKKWQDFSTQMTRAGQTIENVFVTGITPLVPGLQRLSAGVADVVKAFLGSPAVKHWIDVLGDGLESFAQYIGTPAFKSDVEEFTAGIGQLAKEVVAALRFLGVIPAEKPEQAGPAAVRPTGIPGVSIVHDPRSAWERLFHPLTMEDIKKMSAGEAPTGAAAATASAETAVPAVAPAVPPIFSGIKAAHERRLAGAGAADWMAGRAGDIPVNNPGNIRPPGQPTKFMQYPSEAAGIRAMAAQLVRDEDVHHQDTIRKIVAGNAEWPGWTSTDVKSYIAGVSARTGIDPDTHIDLHDRDTLAKLIAAMTKQEKVSSRITPQTVVTVMNNTGGNAIVTASQMAW